MTVPTRVVLGDMGAIGLLAAVAIELLATLLLIRVAAGIYERSILRIGAPISLRSALATVGATTDHAHIHVPPALLQGAAVAALLGGVIVGTSELLGLVLLATGLLLVAVYQCGRRHPPTPHR
jgi:hypothetical protein